MARMARDLANSFQPILKKFRLSLKTYFPFNDLIVGFDLVVFNGNKRTVSVRVSAASWTQNYLQGNKTKIAWTYIKARPGDCCFLVSIKKKICTGRILTKKRKKSSMNVHRNQLWTSEIFITVAFWFLQSKKPIRVKICQKSVTEIPNL